MNTRYKIQKELGDGGMAVVYLAEDTHLHSRVALKVLRKEMANNGNIHRRFVSEARSMFRMAHPNIIKVIDLINDADTVAIVMEYVEGETLKEYIERKGRLNDTEIKNLLAQMLEALEYVHEQGLIHRDIKPSNFMITSKGKIKLMDFGISKNTDPTSSDYTSTGTAQQMGTPMYMSPEQVHETKNVTAQSDIYSLGVVLWQMVTGKRPYDTQTLSNFQLQSKIVNEPLPTTNSKWDKVIQKATAKNLGDRYQSALFFLRDLNNPDSTGNGVDSTIIEQPSTQSTQHLNQPDQTGSVTKPASVSNAINSEGQNTPKNTHTGKIIFGVLAIVCVIVILALANQDTGEAYRAEYSNSSSDSAYDNIPSVDSVEYFDNSSSATADTTISDDGRAYFDCNDGKQISVSWLEDGQCDCRDCEDEYKYK